MVIWVTGLSGAGKTTLCEGIYQQLKPHIPEVVLLDGDIVREAFGNDLTHKEADRVVQVKRLRGMSKVLAEQGMVVIVAVLYAEPGLLAWNRENIPNYFEVYLDASLETVMARDSKGLYAKAKAGTMPDVVGMDIPWYPPERPDLVLTANGEVSPEALQRRLIDALPESIRGRIPAI